jgi:diguanylate cyclase (GGDEF)-like protein
MPRPPTPPAPRASRALRLARTAWQSLHSDSARAIALADQAFAAAGGELRAEGWARVARGFHALYFDTPRAALSELTEAQRCLTQADDAAGRVLAGAGIARAMWRDGQFRASLELALSLRDEGVRVLKHEQRGLLLNAIAGCYSSLGDPERAFAYLYQALRVVPPGRGHGYDAVLHCNLSHELLQLGDYHEALRHVDHGLERCAQLNNPRLLAVLRINRVICLTELDRACEALPDLEALRAQPADAGGRGVMATYYETMAIAALRAGELALGAQLVALGAAAQRPPIPDDHVEFAVAKALLALAQGDHAEGLAQLAEVESYTAGDGAEGLSLRVHCLFFHAMSELHERAGRPEHALAAMRNWQSVHVRRAQLASRARFAAAALQTELLSLQHRIAEKDAQRRATEAARAQLQTINEQLSQRIEQVQSLEQALREQVIRDDLTGLHNRRYLNEALPALWALALRDAQPLSVVIIDLDHFKAINDSHGHAAGDHLLAAFGRQLAESLRKSDVACRYGGEEFCLLMPHTDAASARQKVQSLLQRWRQSVFTFDSGVVSGTSFSAGVCDSTLATASAEALLRSADEELLAAKRRGRNLVLVAKAA